MKLRKMAAAFTAAILMTAAPFGAYAEDDADIFEESDGYGDEVDDSDYITDSSGLYKYSLADDGVVIEEYLGSEKSVVIPEELDGVKVTGLGDYAYYMHDEITDITISKNVVDFAWFPFYGCTSLKEFKVDPDNPIYTADEQGILFDKAGQCLMAYPAALEQEEYAIPDGIVCINNSAFACNPYIKKVTIPEGVVADYMGIRAFAECTALETVVFPESLTKITEFCFAACTSLKNVDFADTLSIIDKAAFYNCTSLEQPSFPDSLTEIGQGAFISTGFDQVTIPATVASIGYSAFGFVTDDEDNIVQMDEFTIYGYNNSSAQTYCNENSLKFVSLNEDVGNAAAEGEKNSSDEKNVSKNRTIAAVVIILVAAAAFAIAILNRKSKKLEDDDLNGDYDEPDESDDEGDGGGDGTETEDNDGDEQIEENESYEPDGLSEGDGEDAVERDGEV